MVSVSDIFVNLLPKVSTFNHNYSLMKNKGLLGAFIGGAIVGAAVGILFAPEKGSDTRAKLSNKVDDFLKKHNIKLNQKDVDDLVDDLDEED